MRKGTRFFLWLTGILIVTLIGFLLVFWFSAPSLVRWFANRQLPKIINAQVSLEKVDLDLSRGYVALHNLRVSQPPGFRKGTLAFVHSLRARLDLSSIFHPPLTVEEVELEGVQFNLAIDKKGTLNLTAVFAPKSPRPRPSPPPNKKTPSRFAIRGRKVVIKDLSSSLIIYGLPAGKKPDFQLQLEDFNLQVTDFLWDPRAPVGGTLPGRALITARIVQKPEDALLEISSRFGPISTRPAVANTVVILHCLELNPLSVYIPAGTNMALGGDAVNLEVAAATAPNLLNARIRAESSGGHSYDISLSGRPEHPVMDLTSLIFQGFIRAGGSLGNVVQNLGSAGGEAGKTALGTVVNVGTGAFNMASSFGVGIFRTLKGVVTLRPKEALGGIEQTTLGTVGKAANLVWDTGHGIVKGVVNSSSASVGAGRGKQWREASLRNWPQACKKAREKLAKMPFPELAEEDEASPKNKPAAAPARGSRADRTPPAEQDDIRGLY